ncbi:carboxylesterase family protein-like protein [Cucurbitaria berberidis CBS 394.84]|uniref:Carboxylic ester hydrolase n=1 Tax=Cucurbitaria berberidis CBS 394.84 TaxID=1168544 RepID=A0A9P4L6U5_9PLEO|nr:carboxylesterase family protein-like protein [Cucurbitaria berberidis CBS 394.84]KAF1843649.1 carboxylesterase family protein-like protein [Cucurbitaria berberidis CBS 394.84]
MLKIFGAAALLGAVYAQNSSLPTVDLGYEIYRAAGFNSTGNFYNFSNIRFAQAPIGNLRFAPPKAPLENRSAINNGDVSRICPQSSPAWGKPATNYLTSLVLGLPAPNETFVVTGANSSSPVPPRDPRESEDCLFLDVFVPEDVLSKAGKGYGAAVLVWIYGGGYTLGNKNLNPAGLIAASGNASNGDIIYVSLNYRLGALGWQSGPSYQAEGGVSNLGLYDQRFALEWVQKYIHLFGGDPNRVTVVGESAGGGSIMHQITAYGGLKGKVPFQQAVPQSPGWQPAQSNLQQEDTYRKLLNLTNSSSLAELRALPSEDIMRANFQQVTYDAEWGSFIYGPVVDGNFVPQQPGQLLAQGRFDQDVRILVGHNANEGTYFTPPSIKSEETLVTQLRSAYPYAPQHSIDTITKDLYPAVFDGSYGYRNQFSRANLIISESVFTCNTNYLSTGFKNETYSYLFAVPPAFHGFDVPYTYYDGGALSLSVMNRTIAIALQQFIASFAENGAPEAGGITQFNMYGPDARVLKLNVTGIEDVRDSNANARCAWWQKALY